MKHRLYAALCILLLAALLRQPTSAATLPTAPPPLPMLAVQVPSSIPTAADLDRLQEAGVRTIRAQVAWSWVETVQGQYVWAYADSVLVPYLQRGLQVQVHICCSPSWMAPYSNWFGPWVSWHAPTFGQFVYRLVQRYAPQGLLYYEVSNEPDMAYPDYKAWVYALYLQQAYQQAHAASANAKIMNGGLAYESTWGPSFVTTNLNALRTYTDYIAFHWYATAQYGSGYATYGAKLNALRAQIGTGKTYLLNEFGVDSVWNGWTEARQATDLQALFTSLRCARPADLYGASLFSFQDNQWGLGFENTGVLRLDNTKKPAWAVLREALR